MVRTYSKGEINYMKLFKLIGLLFLILILFSKPSHSANDETTIYEKIDIFSDVLDKINKEYVDEINQNEVMDAAINGVLQSLSEQVLEELKRQGIKDSKIEGRDSNDWKLVDGIDLIIHIFNPEKRKFYELEKIWSELIPKEKVIV